MNNKNNQQYTCLVAIYDKKAETYDNFFTVPNTVAAVRGFMDACKNPESPFHKYPEDFKLVFIGEIDVKTGKIKQREVMETLLEAVNVVQSK